MAPLTRTTSNIKTQNQHSVETRAVTQGARHIPVRHQTPPGVPAAVAVGMSTWPPPQETR